MGNRRGDLSTLAFGIFAANRPRHPQLGRALEHLGYEELWVNDMPGGDGLATIAAIASGTAILRFGVGVVALSEYSAPEIAARVRAAGVPMNRLTLGVGSGSSASLRLVAAEVASLRNLLPGIPVAVAAVGPRMARLAGETADAVVANWSRPDRLTWLRQRISEGARAAGRPEPRLVAYVRSTVGPAAEGRLRTEMDRYRQYGRGQYARAFDDRPNELVGVAAEAPGLAVLGPLLAPYQAVADTTVVRGVPSEDTIERWLEIADAGAPTMGPSSVSAALTSR